MSRRRVVDGRSTAQSQRLSVTVFNLRRLDSRPTGVGGRPQAPLGGAGPLSHAHENSEDRQATRSSLTGEWYRRVCEWPRRPAARLGPRRRGCGRAGVVRLRRRCQLRAVSFSGDRLN
jgi:hypothetical protein